MNIPGVVALSSSSGSSCGQNCDIGPVLRCPEGVRLRPAVPQTLEDTMVFGLQNQYDWIHYGVDTVWTFWRVYRPQLWGAERGLECLDFDKI